MVMRRVAVEFAGALVNGGGVSHLWFDGAGTTPEDAHGAVATLFAGLRNLMHSSVSYTVAPEVDDIDETTGQLVAVNQVAAVSSTGADSSDPLPTSTQALLRFRTGAFVNGREVRGRMFVPGFTEFSNTAGKPTASIVSDVNGYLATLVNDPDANFSVYSKTHRQEYTVLTATMWNQWAVLRSRRD